jgi:hypothetical protein
MWPTGSQMDGIINADESTIHKCFAKCGLILSEDRTDE